jgi:hypothetical protein
MLPPRPTQNLSALEEELDRVAEQVLHLFGELAVPGQVRIGVE